MTTNNNQYTFPDGTTIDFGNRDPQEVLDEYAKYVARADTSAHPKEVNNTAVDESHDKPFGERCLTKDTDDFPELKGKDESRCLNCLIWETIDRDFLPKSKVIEARIDEMHRAADAHRLAGGKGLPKGFQRRMNELQEIKNTLGIGGA